ncbi:element excision factor XisH family protein [Phormidesmis sp. 146-35]
MSARDSFHETVKQALVKDSWVNVAPLTLRYGATKLEVDLGAEQVLVAQKDSVQIAIEVKSFSAASVVYEFHQAIGQYIHYRMVLRQTQPNRIPYLALPDEIHHRFFLTPFFHDSLEENQVRLLLVDPDLEEVKQWIPKPL